MSVTYRQYVEREKYCSVVWLLVQIFSVALASGGILEIPWVFVDPRRPITVTPEMREEGVIPYMPELPMSSESIINYNQTVQRVKGIHTAPSGLESTCLVFVYGLGMYWLEYVPLRTNGWILSVHLQLYPEVLILRGQSCVERKYILTLMSIATCK